MKGPVIMGFGVKQAVGRERLQQSKLLKTFELKDDVDQTFQFDVWIDKEHFPYFSFVNGSGKPITQVRSNIRRRKLPSSAMKQPYRGPEFESASSQLKDHSLTSGRRSRSRQRTTQIRFRILRQPPLVKKSCFVFAIERFVAAFRNPKSLRISII